jgi:preprotein translocase subunit SecD
MNRYPVWKYAVILIVLLVSVLFALPNLFGDTPAVQISSTKSNIKVDAVTQTKIEDALKAAGLKAESSTIDAKSIKLLFKDREVQREAKEAIQKSLVPDPVNANFVVALNSVTLSPKWLTNMGATPMYLGLDLRGGVHFLMQVDMPAALTKKTEAMTGDIRSALREKNARHGGVSRNGKNIEIRFRDQETLAAAKVVIADQFPELLATDAPEGTEYKLTATIKPEAALKIQDQALKQNILTLHNRINELGVAEPVIQQQGLDRIVIQLPGVEDPTKAKEIIGRTATLELRMVDESPDGQAAESNNGSVPFGSERFLERNGRPVIVKKQVILTGENLTDAQAGIDGQTQGATVNLSLDAKGSRIFADITRENINKRMAIILFEKGRGEVVTAPVIRSEINGGRVQISGSMNTTEANDTALLLRAGSLAAPMEFIEESSIGPSLGKENIDKGFNSVKWGFLVIVAFMCVYYMMFGAFSALSLGVNLLMLVAVLSMLQATLTLPGIAAMALALGMAIDSNVLINERVREELRGGASPQAAIATGYERAWATIFDSNITTLIAGVALLAFGSGPVRGFAVVHCIGILTSMFSAVFFSRGLVNLWYGRQKKLKSVSIGTIWTPDSDATTPSTITK